MLPADIQAKMRMRKKRRRPSSSSPSIPSRLWERRFKARRKTAAMNPLAKFPSSPTSTNCRQAYELRPQATWVWQREDTAKASLPIHTHRVPRKKSTASHEGKQGRKEGGEEGGVTYEVGNGIEPTLSSLSLFLLSLGRKRKEEEETRP